MTERRLYAMWMHSSLIPEPDSGEVQRLDLPDLVTQELDEGGWNVVHHTVKVPDLSGDMLLTLYVER